MADYGHTDHMPVFHGSQDDIRASIGRAEPPAPILAKAPNPGRAINAAVAVYNSPGGAGAALKAPLPTAPPSGRGIGAASAVAATGPKPTFSVPPIPSQPPSRLSGAIAAANITPKPKGNKAI